MSEPPVSVMVVDDHPMWRDGVARDLTERGFQVLATAGDAASALRIARTVKPDVVLMDLNLGDSSGVNATLQITQEIPGTRVLVLSASGEHSDVLEAVKAGASGYLVKSASAEELVDAVRRTAAGDAVFTAGLAGHRREWLPMNSAIVATAPLSRRPPRRSTRLASAARRSAPWLAHTFRRRPRPSSSAGSARR